MNDENEITPMNSAKFNEWMRDQVVLVLINTRLCYEQAHGLAEAGDFSAFDSAVFGWCYTHVTRAVRESDNRWLRRLWDTPGGSDGFVAVAKLALWTYWREQAVTEGRARNLSGGSVSLFDKRCRTAANFRDKLDVEFNAAQMKAVPDPAQDVPNVKPKCAFPYGGPQPDAVLADAAAELKTDEPKPIYWRTSDTGGGTAKPINHGKPWSHATKMALLDLFFAGYSAQQLAAMFGRSRSSICGLLYDLGALGYDSTVCAYYKTGRSQADLIVSAQSTPEKSEDPSAAPAAPPLATTVAELNQLKEEDMSILAMNLGTTQGTTITIDATSPLVSVTKQFCFGQPVEGMSNNQLLAAIVRVDEQIKALDTCAAASSDFVKGQLTLLKDQRDDLIAILDDKNGMVSVKQAKAKRPDPAFNAPNRERRQ